MTQRRAQQKILWHPEVFDRYPGERQATAQQREGNQIPEARVLIFDLPRHCRGKAFRQGQINTYHVIRV
jgi:hypothetical protein